MALPEGEKIVETKTCPLSGKEFHITDGDIKYYDSISPTFNGQKFLIPNPTLHPHERERRRMAWSNEQFLYHRKCDLTGKPIVSEFSPENPRKVYDFRTWWTDEYNPFEHGRRIDWDRPIMKQFYQLELETPHACVSTDRSNENSDYTHQAGHEKNCYLMFHTSYAEDCYYGYGVKEAKSCVDTYYCHGSEFCYECTDIKGCADLFWSQDCQNCRESFFIKDCIGCDHCFLCAGLRNKQYCINNAQYTKEEYEQKLSEIRLESQSDVLPLMKRLAEIDLTRPHKYLRNIQIENATGNYLTNARDCVECYDCSDIEYSRYCSQMQLGTKYCYDIYQFGLNMDHCYETSQTGYNISNCFFCYNLVNNCQTLMYCATMYSSRNSSLCFGMKKGENCILNTAYSKREYEENMAKIIPKLTEEGVWGECLSIEDCPYGYNETMANVWYPLDKSEALKRGYKWRDDDETSSYHGDYYQPLPISQYDETKVPAEEARKNIEECLQGILKCQETGKPFKIIKQELIFYIENNIPLPTLSPDARRQRRYLKRLPRQLFDRTCDKCSVAMQSAYDPKRPEKVYCEECFQKEVY